MFLKRADRAAETAAPERSHLADRAFRLRDPARVVLVQDVGGGDRVDVRPRRIAIVGAEDIEDLLGAFRRGEPGRDPRLDRRPVRPDEYFPRPGNEGGAHEQGQLTRRRHVDRLRRGQRGVAAAVGDRIDERRFCGAVLAEDVAREILNLRAAAGHAAGLPSAGEAILATQHAIDLLRLEAGELFWRGPGAVKAQRRDLVGLGLRRIEAAVGALGFEHGEHAGDAIARQAEFGRLRSSSSSSSSSAGTPTVSTSRIAASGS